MAVKAISLLSPISRILPWSSRSSQRRSAMPLDSFSTDEDLLSKSKSLHFANTKRLFVNDVTHTYFDHLHPLLARFDRTWPMYYIVADSLIPHFWAQIGYIPYFFVCGPNFIIISAEQNFLHLLSYFVIFVLIQN